MSVLVQRALPDARDGLKPVQRRILQTMRDEGLHPSRAFKKCATVVGTALGRYHPHGDSSVYDALVRLAQPFVMAEPLVDGQGNFGSLDGDRAAAYRYTEARMTPAAAAMLADLDKHTVPFRDNFDGRHQEPEVLPAALPNLLLNGADGIAVGMATKIPPHNLKELVAALVCLCETPDAPDEIVLRSIKGPDFPTGAAVLRDSEFKAFYRTGRGKLTVRATAQMEPVRGGRSAIVITEIPYGVTKSTLLTAISDLVKAAVAAKSAAKTAAKATKSSREAGYPWADWIADLRDESNREGVRIVVECKPQIDPGMVLEALYVKTALQTTYGAQLLALVEGVPTALTVRRALAVYLAHRVTVTTRRLQFDLAAAEARRHIVDGLLVAIRAIDAVVRLLKRAVDQAAARRELQREFALTDIQATAILSLRLAGLTALDVQSLVAEGAQLATQITGWQRVLAEPAAVRRLVQEELQGMAATFARPRRTQILASHGVKAALPSLATVQTALTIDATGHVRCADDAARGRGRPGWRLDALGVEETALVWTSAGRCYPLTAADAPLGNARVPLTQLLPALAADERVLAVVSPLQLAQGVDVVFVLANGLVKRMAAAEGLTARRAGVPVTTLHPTDRLVAILVAPSTAAPDVVVVAAHGRGLRLTADGIPRQGRAARGVAGLRLAADDTVVGAALATGPLCLLSTQGHAKAIPVADWPTQGRGGQGVLVARPTPASGLLAGVAVPGPVLRLAVGGARGGLEWCDAVVPTRARSAALAAVAAEVPPTGWARVGAWETVS